MCGVALLPGSTVATTGVWVCNENQSLWRSYHLPRFKALRRQNDLEAWTMRSFHKLREMLFRRAVHCRLSPSAGERGRHLPAREVIVSQI